MRDRSKYPLWVRVSLWGLQDRSSVLLFFWLSLFFAVCSFIAGFWYPLFFWGLLFLFSALAYWLPMRWVDKNDYWVDPFVDDEYYDHEDPPRLG